MGNGTSITLDDGSTNWTSNYGYKNGSEIGFLILVVAFQDFLLKQAQLITMLL